MARVEVKPDDTLVFDADKPQLDIELAMLRRIILNGSECARLVRQHAVRMNGEGRLDHYHRRSVLRFADIMNDSMEQVTMLLEGKDLDEKIAYYDPDDAEPWDGPQPIKVEKGREHPDGW